jgi:regulator of nonsense transcripts 1
MNLAALIQARKPQHSKRRHSPVLFLVDINATVDSAADRYHNLCKAAGLRLRIIRMHGWPYELRNSGKLQPEGTKGQTGDSAADFTKKFLTTVNLAQHTNLQRSPDKAPTLDEAAWEYYERHKHHCDQFVGLDRLLKRMDAGEVFSAEDWKSLRNRISTLYRAVLAQTDFIATTPAAVYGSFPSFFKPDVIFVDEAPHARELTTLIPIAYFDPFAWIFTGDVKQTRPFVKGGYREEMRREGLQYNPFTGQLRLSTMARADTAGVIDSKLLVNQRAHGNLQRLPSKMFYEDRMSSGHIGAKKFPQSTRHLQRYLEQLDGRQGLTETRVVVELEGSEETRQGASFWNPCHQRWVLSQVQVLLADSKFKSLEGGPGIIMIQTPYGTSSRQYQAQVKQWSPEWQDRVQVCTVDKAQGNQADVVFLDMVRTSGAGFMNDPQRLNVAITRARQAEVIVMHKEMSFRYFKGRKIRSEFVSQIWDDAEEGKRLVKLCGVPSVLGQM